MSCNKRRARQIEVALWKGDHHERVIAHVERLQVKRKSKKRTKIRRPSW